MQNDTADINIGDFNAGLSADKENCKIIFSANISLPEDTETVIVSARLDTTNGFQVYKKVIRIYEVVSDLGWSTVIGAGSCED